MTYKVIFEQKPTYLHAIVTGRNSKENVMRFLEDILRESIARGCSRVLIEERLEGPRLEMLDIFSIAEKGSSPIRGKLKAIAYIDVNARGNLMQFAETVAVNRGVPVTVFSNVADAENWLLKENHKDTEQHTATNTEKLPAELLYPIDAFGSEKER